jgi:plastocyanin
MKKRLVIAAAYAFTMGLVVAAQAATTLTVSQHGMALSKTSATISRGDKIVFTNEDDVIHNIHIFGPGDFDKDLGLQKPGATLSYVFDKTGSVRIRCNIHPSVKMTVTVN